MSWTKKTFVDNQTVIDATFLNGIQDELIKCIQPYATGEKFPSASTYLIKAGYITSKSTTIYFSVEFPRSLKNINTITFNGTWVARGINGHIETSTDDKRFDDTTYHLTMSKTNDSIFCSLSKADGTTWKYTNNTEVTNNGLIEIVLHGYFSFS